MNPAPDYFRVCSICRKPIEFGARYFACSVSTCNKSRIPLFFCSLSCFSAHLPEARHRDAWAEETTAPTRAEVERVQAEAAAVEQRREQRQARIVETVNTPLSEDAPREVLVVVSKLKGYVKARSGMNTGDAVIDVLSDLLRKECDKAIEKARLAGRKTLLDRDFED